MKIIPASKTKPPEKITNLSKKTVAQNFVILERNIKSQEHIQHKIAPQKRNRRFKRNIAVDKRKEKCKRYKARKKDNITEITENAPDQNAIN